MNWTHRKSKDNKVRYYFLTANGYEWAIYVYTHRHKYLGRKAYFTTEYRLYKTPVELVDADGDNRIEVYLDFEFKNVSKLKKILIEKIHKGVL
jgi:hypothetical protein